MPIIIVSARGMEQEKVEALDAGADDYVTKPFNAGELLARIRVALRHKGASPKQEPVFDWIISAWILRSGRCTPMTRRST